MDKITSRWKPQPRVIPEHESFLRRFMRAVKQIARKSWDFCLGTRMRGRRAIR
jgi:hypothetical protein